ncbi:adenine-specific DNA methylase [Subdoligranulum sp. CAG:314]|jgi:adenine-specific DNA methylase|nr:adenine-specific DNA methylase [Subdoligranulum sp. CAG:314]
MLKINNRRYIGNKTKLIGRIEQAIDSAMNLENFSVADLFAGTGIVAYTYAIKGHPVIVNDTLYSNVVAYRAILSNDFYDKNKLIKLIEQINQIPYKDIEENYFSRIYGNKYYSINDAKKIGYIREFIEAQKDNLTNREYFILLASLLYAADKIANTVGHFEYFLKKVPSDTDFKLEMFELQNLNNVIIYNEDANELSRKIKSDVIYIDPPYNARQYINFYHVLENLARWNKPDVFEGNSMKFLRNELKSGYSTASAPKLFSDLIQNLKCKLIVVSYNNTYSASSSASNNRIQEQELLSILSTRGKVEKIEIDYKSFNAGKTDFKNHQEYLFVCKVGD